MRQFFRNRLRNLLVAGVSLLGAGPFAARGQVVVDGTRDALYGTALALQTAPTGFGDATLGSQTLADGSELDGAYAHIANGKLYLLLTGNLQSNGNRLELFFDTRAGGQNQLLNTNPTVDGNGLNRMAGLTFDAGFAPDHYLTLNATENAGAVQLAAHYAPISGAGGSGLTLTSGTAGANVALSFGGSLNGELTINNSNIAGVSGTAVGTPDAVTTGIELAIPLAAIGSPTGDIRVMVAVNGGSHDFLSNQLLAGLPAAAANLGDPATVSLAAAANTGNQFFTITNTGTAAAGISATPSPLLVGTATVGTAPATAPLTVTNTGSAPLTISGVTSSNTRFTVSPTTATVAAGASTTLTVTFTPTAAGAQSGNLTIASNAAGQASLVVPVSGTGAAAGAIAIDGSLDAALYGAAVAVQTNPTGFGNSTSGNVQVATGGSELDAAYAHIANGKLYLLLTGNLETNGNRLELFFDTQTGGQNQLLNTNPDIDGNGLNRMAGLRFDAGFTADYYLTVNNTNPGAGYTTAAYFAPVNGSGGAGIALVNGLGNTQTLNFGGGLTGNFGINNSNTGGVSGTTVGTPAAVTTGIELAIPLAAIGNPSGAFRVTAFVNGASHDFLSNQILAPLPSGVANLGNPAGVNFTAPANVGDQFFTITAPAATAALTLSATSAAFGNVTAGSTGTQTLTLTNSGGAPLTISGITSSNPLFTASPTTGTVAVGASLTVTLTFAPTAAGAQTGTLSIASNDPGSPATVSLTGTSTTAPAPVIGVVPGSLTLGNVIVGATGTATFTIDNTGNAPLNVTGITSSNARFTAAPTTGTVAAGASLTVTVTFAPTAVGAQTGTLTVASNGGTATVALTGTGTAVPAPVISVTPTSLALGTVDIGATGTATFTINNTGNAPLDVTGITSSNTVFTATPTTGNVAGGASLIVTVTFAPTAAGAATGTLTLASNGGTATVSLTGTGVVPPFISVDGTRDANYGTALAVQTNTTGFGNSTSGNVDLAGGSELDAAYARIDNGTLYLLLAGNLESNGNRLDLFFDTNSGTGQNVLTNTNPNVDGNGLNRQAGLRFDAGFTADYFLTANNSNPAAGFTTAAYFAPVNGAGGTGTVLANGLGRTQTLAFGGGNTGSLSLNNSNILGVDGTLLGNPGAVTTGLELAIPLAALGNPTGPIRVSAFINNDSHSYLSNQVLAGLPLGTTNLEDPANVNFGSATNAGSQFFTIANGPAAAVITVAPTALTFPATVIGTPTTATFTIGNAGNGPLDVTGITSSNAAFTVAPATGTVAAGASLTVTVTFDPTATGAATGTLTVASNDPGQPSLTVTLTGTATAAPAPIIGVTPATLALGSTATGTTTTATFTIDNTGNAPLDVTGITSSDAAFTVSPTTGTVAAGASLTVTVTFAPTATGAQTGTLTVASNGGTATVALTGTGTVPVPAFVDGVLDASGDYGTAATLQTNTTGFGNATAANGFGGSELDGAYARIANGNLYLLLTGNLQANGNDLEIFFDTQAGGQNVLANNNPDVDGNGLNRQAGLTFDATFAPDYYLTVQQTQSGGQPLLTAHHAALNGAGGTGLTLTSGATGTVQSLDFATFGTGAVALNNTNEAGVDGTAVGTPGAVTTGLELQIPLAALGNPVGQFKISAFINGGSHDFLSNQVLAGLPLGTANLGDPASVNFAAAANTGDQFFLAGTPLPAPIISVTPTTLAFGNTTVGTPTTQTVTIANTGNAPLTVTGITSSDALFTATPTTSTVAAGASLTVTVTFDPTAPGAATGTLTIASDDVANPTVTVALTGTGVAAPAPVLAVTPATLALGSVTTGTTGTATFTIDNTGNAPLDVTGITSSDAAFTVSPTTGTVAPGASLTVTVTFAPTTAGAATGTLTVASNGGTATVALTGAGVAPAPVISVTPTTLAFGTLTVGTPASQTLTISNTGTAALNVTGITSSNALFTATPTTGTVAPGASLTVTVTFDPTAAGAATGTLTIASDDVANPALTVALTGNAVAAPTAIISVTPTTLALGSVTTGTTGTATFTIDNTGNAPLTVTGITSSDAAFTVSPTTGTVAPGAALTVTVTFAPTTDGPATGTLTIASDDAANPAVTVALTGTGVAPAAVLAVTPATLDLGSTVTGTTTTATFTISNTGNAPLDVTGITSSDAAFTVAPATGTVAPGASLTVTVTFAPTAAGAATGTLTIASNGGTATVALTGAGTTPPAPVLAVMTTTLDLGSTATGTTTTATFTISNAGNAPLDVTGITSSGAAFTVSPTTGTVAPGASLTVTVTFAPTAAGAATGTLTIASNGGTATVALTGAGTTPAAVTVDGTLDATYGTPLVVQTNTTGFGNSTTGTIDVAGGGSELDGAFAHIANGNLYLLLTGNLESNGNRLELFFDTQTGGQNQLTNTNPDVDGNGLNRQAGLTFDAGFAPDYYLTLNNTNPAAGFTTAAYFAPVNGAGGTGTTLANGLGRTQTLTFGAGTTGALSLNNSNILGVDGTTLGDPGAVTTGVELAIPLAAIGNPTGPIRISAFINGGSHDFVSNQVLAGLPLGTANLGDPAAVNFASAANAGNQFFTVPNGVPTPTIAVTPTTLAFGTVTVGAPTTQTLTISNSGTGPLTVTGITSANAAFTVSPTTGTVAPGASLTVTVTFDPTAAGAATGTLTIASDDAANPAVTVALTGNGVLAPAPIIAVAPATLDLGSAATGVTTTATFTISNTGNAPLDLTGITSSNAVFTVAPATGTVAPGASLTVTVTFAPTTVGAQTGTLTIASNDPATPSVTVALTGTGVAPTAVTVDGTLDATYGTPLVVQTNTTNFGNSTTGTIDVAGGGSELDGAFAHIANGNLYLLLTGNLESNGNRLELFFDTQTGGQNQLTNTNPDVDGNGLNRQAGLTFDAGFAPDYYLTFNTTHPVAGFTTAADFAPVNGAGGTGTTLANGLGRTQPLTFGAGQTGTLSLNNSNILGVDGTVLGNPGAVTTGVELAIPLAAIGNPTGPIRISAFINGASHDFVSNQVLAGLPLGTLNLGDPANVNLASAANAGNQFFTVPNGVPTPTIAVTPTTLAFGTVTVGTPTTQTLTISNSGTGPLSVTGITSSNAAFTATPTTGTVAPGASLTVTVTFDPTAAGAATGTLTIASDDAANPAVTVALTGNGVLAPAPIIAVAPATLDLGSAATGVTTTATFTISNTGNAPLDLTGITSSNAVFTVAPATGTVAPGASLTVTVTFAPTAVGAQTGTLTIASNDPATPSVTVALTGTGVAPTTIVVDGTLDAAAYGTPLTVQTAATGFGNSTTGTIDVAGGGSELDAAFARIENGNLYLLLTGNLESNGNRLELFFDTQAGGQNQLLNTNPDVDGNGLNRQAGLTFDAGFAPDYYLTFNNTNPAAGFTTAAYFASVNGAGGTGTTLANGLGRTQTLTFGAGQTGALSLNNSNILGVDGTTLGNPGAVTTGVELAIPLAALGNPTGPIRISAFVNGGSHDFVSNQVLAGLPLGTANLGDPAAVNFASAANAGNQFFVVPNGSTPAAVISVSANALPVGNVVVGATGTATLTISNTGNAPLDLTGITSSNPLFTVAPATGTVAPGATLTVTVTFAPTAVGAQTGTLTIASNDPAQPTLTVAVSGTGTAAPAGVLTASVTTLSLGTVAVGSTGTATFTITNTGNAPVTAFTVTTSAGAFTATPATAGPLAPGDSVTITVTFAPTSTGAQTGTLTISAAGLPDLTVNLTGDTLLGLTPDAVAANLQVYPNPTTPGQPVTVEWTGAGTLQAPVTVFDALGRPVRRATLLNGKLTLTDLSHGLYTLRVLTPAGPATRRLVVE